MKPCFLFLLVALNGYSAIWMEKTHNDFADGQEYYYRGGDTASYWTNDTLRTWNPGSRIYSPTEGGLRIIGQDWDLDDNGWIDVILTPNGSYTTIIYWNGISGFNTGNKTELNTQGANPQGVSLCDLNRDGQLEILIGNFTANWAYIYDGNTYSKYDSVKIGSENQTVYPADLNNDGEIDLITPSKYWTYIYYGPGPFYLKTPIDSLYIPNAAPASGVGITVADLNYDKLLDIIMSSQSGNLFIYSGNSWGGAADIILNCTSNWDHSIADLNRDGYLDIFVNASSTKDTIFWGSSSGFVATSCPGNGTGDCSIADINMDGNLDITTTQSNVDSGFIIWGPTYNNYTSLTCPGTNVFVNEVADFDNDADLDVLFGSTNGQSYIYWNNGGFSNVDRFSFPTSSDDALFEDLGNLWDRTNEQKYLSSVFESVDTIKTIDSVKWWGNFPSGTDIELWMRAAYDTSSWRKWVKLTNGGTDSSLFPSRYLQYRCVFSIEYKNTSLFSFDSMEVFYDTGIASVETKTESYKYFNFIVSSSIKDNIKFTLELPMDGKLSLEIYNLAGEKVRTLINRERYLTGKYQEMWDTQNDFGGKVKSGIYFCTIRVETNSILLTKTNKLIIIGR